MNRDDQFQVYLNLANALFENRVSKRSFLNFIAKLPPLEKSLLNKLAEVAEGFALTEPRRGWAIAYVADQAATSQKCEPFLKSLAAWYLGRASNHWGQPKRVKAAIIRARRGFRKLGEAGWVAACDWQSNILSWTKSDIVRSVRELQQALTDLRQEGFVQFVPDCQRSLGYAQVMIGEFEQANENFLASEAAFAAEGDALNQAHCWLNKTSLLRRKARFDEAVQILNKALTVFENTSALIDIAHVYTQLALIYLLRTENLSKAISHLEKAKQIYNKADLELWWADCTTILGAIYMQNGQFEKADGLLRHARPSFTRHGVPGLLANNLNDSGKLNMLRGRPNISVRQYKRAKELYEKLGAKFPAAIDDANLGEVYGQVGQYQDSLHYLEHAVESLEAFGNPHRLGSCERYIAMIWSELGLPTLAHEHLDKAEVCFEKTKQKALLSSVYNSRARVYLQQSQPTEAIKWLKKALSFSEEQGLHPQAALSKRLLGEALLDGEQTEDAVNYLRQALSDFIEMGMVFEHAAVLVDLGFYFAKVHDAHSALDAFTESLHLSQAIFPEIEWRAQAGLADLARMEGRIQDEILAYRLGSKALSKIRRNFWQASLVGSYLQSPSEFFDKAITLAGKIESVEDALEFIEENKATSFLQLLSMTPTFGETRKIQKLKDIKGQIDRLQAQMRVSFDVTSPLRSEFQARQLKSELIEKVNLYNTKMDQIERQNYFSNEIMVNPGFNPTVFREFATHMLGNSWVALDYYILDDELIIVAITPDSTKIHVVPLSMRIIMSIDIVTRPRHDASSPALTERDLKLLGNLLIPAQIAEFLSPNTYLLLVPHKSLHRIPWAALQLSQDSLPLVYTCIPGIVPSLRGLISIWKRPALQSSPSKHDGLLVGLSNFQGLRRDLPFVKDELLALNQDLGSRGSLLAEKDATWENLKRLCNNYGPNQGNVGLSRFDWLHIASHVFADTHSGRLSGIALADRDVWLDELTSLAPLPKLVSFSACNSIYSYVYKGDEHVGLPTTCLAAGADCVVGSIWPILDEPAAEFSIAFYDNYHKGSSPALAVAQAQRKMARQKEPIYNWASFVSVGVP